VKITLEMIEEEPMMSKDGRLFVEGEPGPKFRVYVKDQMQGGFDTLEEARGWVASRRQDQNVEIWEGNKRVFGREPLP
jgi:hypothetical protein